MFWSSNQQTRNKNDRWVGLGASLPAGLPRLIQKSKIIINHKSQYIVTAACTSWRTTEMASYTKVSSVEGSVQNGDLEEGCCLIVTKRDDTAKEATEGDDWDILCSFVLWSILMTFFCSPCLIVVLLCNEGFGLDVAQWPLFIVKVVSVVTLAVAFTFHPLPKENVAKSSTEETAQGDSKSHNCNKRPDFNRTVLYMHLFFILMALCLSISLFCAVCFGPDTAVRPLFMATVVFWATLVIPCAILTMDERAAISKAAKGDKNHDNLTDLTKPQKVASQNDKNESSTLQLLILLLPLYYVTLVVGLVHLVVHIGELNGLHSSLK
jgi:hypothetical protein